MEALLNRHLDYEYDEKQLTFVLPAVVTRDGHQIFPDFAAAANVCVCGCWSVCVCARARVCVCSC